MNSTNSGSAEKKASARSLTTFLPQGSWEVWGPPLALIVFLFLTELLGDWGRENLRYERVAIAGGEWWRLVTGNFVHLGWYHWFLNELGLAVLVLLCPQALSPAVWARRILLVSVAMALCLYFLVPSLGNYVGLSGTIHGLFVLGLMPQVLKKDLIAMGCLAYLLGKVGYELWAGAPVSDEQAIGGYVVVQSHFYGSLCALIYGLVFRSFTRTETWSWKRT